MTPSRRQLRFSREGFTLLEVLVASAILGVVMMVLLSTLSTSMSLWRNTEGKAASDREARASGLLLAQDLANVVMPANPNLWPRVVTSRVGGENVVSLRFLTAKPGDYQTNAGDAGDVCYVEYAVVPSTNGPGREVRRLLWPSAQTYASVIQAGALPTSAQAPDQYQSLGLNLRPTNNMAARGLGPLASANESAFNTNFVLLGRNMLPFTGPPSTNNYPAAVEVNFSVADRTTLANSNIISRANYVLRNAGLYSFRLPLPPPPNAP
jgi:prepilin-type N-terminal cleavage/methylation domain-containing protein